MDSPQLLFVAIGLCGTLAFVAALLGSRRWQRRLIDVRTLLLLAALAWVPATIDLIVQQQLLNATQLGEWISGQLFERFQVPTTSSSTTTTTP
jgi:hypothetical protein